MLSLWGRLSGRDKTITALKRLPFVAGKLLPLEIDVKFMTLSCELRAASGGMIARRAKNREQMAVSLELIVAWFWQ